ncbi:MAG: hypothetical protein Q9160_003228 [Pyrenula sp. 1 TL-2023]
MSLNHVERAKECSHLTNNDQILQWNNVVPEAVERCVHDLIAERVVYEPNLPAVCSWDGDLSYKELFEYSDRLAHYLRNQGVKPETLVPLCFGKSKWAIVAMVAVLRAGGAFVSLDASQPKQRLRYQIEKAQAHLVLSSDQSHILCEKIVGEVFVINAENISKLPDASLSQISTDSNSAAYVIFTSGSTGLPKGVVLEHKQLSTSSTYHGSIYGFSRNSRVLQFASYSFDACMLEIFTTLIFGGCVCIPSEDDRMNALGAAMKRMRVNTAVFTPSLLSNLHAEDILHLDTIVLGGESPSAALVDDWSRRVKLQLGYGPTEATVLCASLNATHSPFMLGDIGRAVGCCLWVVDSDDPNKLVSMGDVGELVVEGAIVARGYLNEPEKTRQAFLNSPAWLPSHRKSSRLYRTGDLVKYNADGSLRFVGRKDDQVKIRGQRLELGEVEHHVRNFFTKVMSVRDAIADVFAATGTKDSKSLAVFLLADAGDTTIPHVHWAEDETPVLHSSEDQRLRFGSLVTELQTNLIDALPAYAIPTVCIPLTKFPLLPSGKVNRNKMKAIAESLPTLAELMGNGFLQKAIPTPIDMSISPTGQKLQILWAEALRIDVTAIESTSNFLLLGGDSVSAIGLVAAARNVGLSLTVETIFKHPTLSEMSNHLQSLAAIPERSLQVTPFSLCGNRETAEQLRDTASKVCNTNITSIEDIYPCSPMQQGLIALSTREPSSYMMQLVYSLSETLDVERFKHAWELVVSQNPILRTRFFEDDSGGLFQVVLAETPQWTTSTQPRDNFIDEDQKKVMNIGQTMSRFATIENDGDRTFVWTIHHALIDAWSLNEVIDRVKKAYHSNEALVAASIPGFITFIKSLIDQDHITSKAFWSSQLADAIPPAFPLLPSRKHRPLAKTVLKHEIAMLPHPASEITKATVVTAAFSLLIGAYSNTDDVVTGITLSGRTVDLPGIERIVGPTIATVPFRARYHSDEGTKEFLRRIQDQYLSIVKYEQLGLQEIRQINKDTEAACNLQNRFTVRSGKESATQRTNSELALEREDMYLVLDAAITFDCEIHDHAILVRASYDDKILDAQQMQRLISQFDQIVRSLSFEDPRLKITDLQRACNTHVDALLQWNGSLTDPVNHLVHDFIAEQAAAQPSHQAICAWDGDLTYRDLDDLASRLASELASSYGIGPNVFVPLCFEKCKWAVVAMLAVLKTGASCVNLDPKHPPSRFRSIFEDLGQNVASVALVSAGNAGLFDGMASALVVDDKHFGSTSEVNTPSEILRAKGSPHDAAFVVFTSGSTGRPKGIVLEHAAVCTSAHEHGTFIGLGPHSRVLQFANYTFDISLSDIFVTLMFGGTVCIPSETERMNDLAGSMRALKATSACLTSTVASQLNPEDVKDLKVLIQAGETMTREIVERWGDRVTLINMYGPGECSIYSSGQRAIKPTDHAGVIGKALGSRIWITNRENPDLLTPIGGIGELLIEGPILARGYLNNEAQIKAAFIDPPAAWSDAFGGKLPVPVGRLYRSGDLGRYNSDGTITYCGRKDDGQVKIHGQRMELAETEYHLRSALGKGVDAAVATVAPGGSGSVALAAFLAVGDRSDSNAEAEGIASSAPQLETFRSILSSGLEKSLRSALPGYMVPTFYIPVTRIPHTGSGKIHRRRLQQIVADMSPEDLTSLVGAKRSHVPPSTPAEHALFDLWKMLLKTDQFGTEDNFFQLGGDSVTAMRLVAAARSKHQMTLTVDKIFENPMLADMALVVAAKGVSDTTEGTSSTSSIAAFSLLGGATDEVLATASQDCQVQIDEIEDVYPLTPQQEYWIVGGFTCYEHQAQSVLLLPDDIDIARFRRAWELITAAHPILRTRMIHVEGRGYFQAVIKGSSPASAIPFQTSTSLASYLDHDRMSLIGLNQSLQRLCIIQDPQQGSARHFVITQNHSSYDGWSLWLLYRDLAHAYHRGFARGSSSSLNQLIAPSVAYLDRAAAAQFWKSNLTGAVTRPLITVPKGYTICPNTQFKRTILLPSRASTATLSTCIEASFAILLTRYLSVPDIILDILLSGRSAAVAGIDELVAPLTTAVPFRVHVDPKEKVHALLARIQRHLTTVTKWEHFGYYGVAALDGEMGRLCRGAVRVNIAPNVPTDEGPGEGLKLDMPMQWGELALILPVRFDLVIEKKGEVEVEAVFDRNLIEVEGMEGMLRRFERILLGVLGADGEKVVGGVEGEVGTEGDGRSRLVENIEVRSAEIKWGLLVSLCFSFSARFICCTD